MALPLEAYVLAWARVLPTVTLVPAFGLRALAPPARGVLALALAASIAPAIAPLEVPFPSPSIVTLVQQLLLGLPVAIATAVPLWAATMAGGVADALRGASDEASMPVVEGRASRFGVLLSMFASAVFLATGGPARVARALATTAAASDGLGHAVHALSTGIATAVAIGAPLLGASIVLEVSFALIARAATPAQAHALFAPLRSMGILAVSAVVLDRVAELLALTARGAP